MARFGAIHVTYPSQVGQTAPGPSSVSASVSGFPSKPPLRLRGESADLNTENGGLVPRVHGTADLIPALGNVAFAVAVRVDRLAHSASVAYNPAFAAGVASCIAETGWTCRLLGV